MRAQDLLLALLCLMGCVSYCGTLSTCKPLNLELVKRKRIEAIRGQILSKLQLAKEPEEDDDGKGDEVPSEVLSVYNSTVEFSEELTHNTKWVESPDDEEESYYAKEVHRFNMTKSKGETVMLFNVTAMKEILGYGPRISEAEFRLLIKDSPDSEQRLELYQGSGNKSRYLNSRFVSSKSNGNWISFDVTETVKNWLENNATVEEALEVKLPCGCGDTNRKMPFKISDLDSNRGDTGGLKWKVAKPHILVMSLPAERVHHLNSRRKRQATGDAVCSEQSDVCCVRRLYIDFRKDLGWKWIHEPSGYFANYCIGSCSFVWNTENKYSQVLALYKHHNPGASAQPCCVPQVLDPLPILYYVGRQHKVEQLSNMIVKTCKCS